MVRSADVCLQQVTRPWGGSAEAERCDGELWAPCFWKSVKPLLCLFLNIFPSEETVEDRGQWLTSHHLEVSRGHDLESSALFACVNSSPCHCTL